MINSWSAADCDTLACELGAAALVVPADLSGSDEVRRLAREAQAALGSAYPGEQRRRAPRGALRGASRSINGAELFPQTARVLRVKAGLNMMTRVMAIERAARGVRVNAIAPGYVETELFKRLATKGILDKDRLSRGTPVGRLGTGDEIAEATVFLASPGASYITGEVLTVDRGWSAYGYI